MIGSITRTSVGLCLILMIGPMPATADIGRLFFTAAERAAFEQARRAAEQMPPAPEVIEAEPGTITDLVEAAPDEPKLTITVDGYVRRSKGRATLWINGENSYDGDLSASGIIPAGARLRGGRISVTPMDDEMPVILRPGQSYDPNSARTTDAYETPALTNESSGP